MNEINLSDMNWCKKTIDDISEQLAANSADAARYKWLRAYMISDNLTYDDLLVAACMNDDLKEFDAIIDKGITNGNDGTKNGT
jgi:hypothetical protein